MLYTIRVYKSRIEGESGRVSPILFESTGCYKTAVISSKDYAEFYGACVIVNNDTGNRIWFEK